MTLDNKSMPMNADPSSEGVWVVDGETALKAPRVRKLSPLLDPADINRFQPHWATCPNADKHRKRTR